MTHNFRKYGSRPWRDREKLREAYHEEDKTQIEIAEEWGCSQATIGKWVIKHDLQKEPDEPWHNEDRLRELYHDKNLSAREIGERLGTTGNTILNQMQKMGIDRRERSKAHQLSMWKSAAEFRTGDAGYEEWRTTIDTEMHQIRHHRLLAVAEYGIQPVKDNVIHHKNRIPWDNRPENIKLMSQSDHAQHHADQRDKYPNLRS